MSYANESQSDLPPLEPLGAWAGRLAPGSMTFSTWQGSEAGDGASMTMPFPTYNEQVDAFARQAHDSGWILPDFDWPRWAGQKQARLYADDPASIADAPAADLFRLLTTILRSERFRDGALQEMLENGVIDAITRRAASLAG